VTSENITINTNAESQRLIELRNEIHSLTVAELSQPLVPFQFTPDALKVISKLPDWLSVRANKLLNDYIEELDLNINDIVQFTSSEELLNTMSKVRPPIKYEGEFIIIDKQVLDGVDFYEIEKKGVSKRLKNKIIKEDNKDAYHNYLKSIDKIYKFTFRPLVENINCFTYMKKEYIYYDRENSKFIEQERWVNISEKKDGYLKELDTFSKFLNVYKFTSMVKI